MAALVVVCGSAAIAQTGPGTAPNTQPTTLPAAPTSIGEVLGAVVSDAPVARLDDGWIEIPVVGLPAPLRIARWAVPESGPCVSAPTESADRWWQLDAETPAALSMGRELAVWFWSSRYNCLVRSSVGPSLTVEDALELATAQSEYADVGVVEVDLFAPPGPEEIAFDWRSLHITAADGAELFSFESESSDAWSETGGRLSVHREPDGAILVQWNGDNFQESCCVVTHGQDERRAWRWAPGASAPELVAWRMGSDGFSDNSEDLASDLAAADSASLESVDLAVGEDCPAPSATLELGDAEEHTRYKMRYPVGEGWLARIGLYDFAGRTLLDRTTLCARAEGRSTESWAWTYTPTGGGPIRIARFSTAGEGASSNALRYQLRTWGEE